MDVDSILQRIRDGQATLPRAPVRAPGKSNFRGLLFGMSVFETPLCVRTVPVRAHKERFRTVAYGPGVVKTVEVPCERGNYHNRIQKKWLKRYGTKVVDDVYIVGGSVFLSPQNFAKIVNAGVTK